MYEVLVLLVLINTGMTIILWQTVRRGPRRKFLKALLYGKAITPKHGGEGVLELHGLLPSDYASIMPLIDGDDKH